MDIDQVITKEEYNSVRELGYDQFSTYLTRLVKLCVEEALKAIPQVATHMAAHAAYMKKLNNDFYKANKDLVNHKRVVAEAIVKVESENPGMSYSNILDKAAVKAREVLPNLNLKTEDGRKKLSLFDDKLGDL